LLHYKFVTDAEFPMSKNIIYDLRFINPLSLKLNVRDFRDIKDKLGPIGTNHWVIKSGFLERLYYFLDFSRFYFSKKYYRLRLKSIFSRKIRVGYLFFNSVKYSD
jgi:hypothetical protein